MLIVRRIVSTCRFIWIIGGAAIVACGCQSPNQKAQPPAAPLSATATIAGSTNSVWSTPPDFPTFGSPTPDSIRVAIFGYPVRRGYYYLPRGATVRDAMEAAQFSGFVWWKRPYCGLQRQRPDGSMETIWFTRESRASDEQRVLQNDDRLRISHEVY
jgi:hypothetical protein